MSHETFAGYALNAGGILSGITFAALVLIIQYENVFVKPFENSAIKDYYPEILIGAMAGVSVSFILSTVAMVRPAAKLGLYSETAQTKEDKDKKAKYTKMTIYLYSIGCYGLMGMLPLLIYPFSKVAAGAILVLEVIVVAILTYLGHKSPTV